MTYLEHPGNFQSITDAINGLTNWSWLFTWGMYLFLILAAAIVFWIFFDSITKNKDEQALVPRILAMVGFFAIIPAFIFRFTGNADGETVRVLCSGESPAGYYPGPINWNVKWLTGGFGPMIAIIALAGVIMGIAAIVIYASSVQRAKPSTEFVQAFNYKMDSLESKVEEAQRNAAAASAASQAAASAASNPTPTPMPMSEARPSENATIIDRKPQAATIIDIPKTGDTITVKSGNGRSRVYDLPANECTVGRDERCFIVLDDGKVSREHVRLSYSGTGWSVLDLGSVNGTYVNNQRISGQLQLANGDEIKLGDTVLVFGTAQ